MPPLPPPLQPVGSLSGGWKMKLALARAILMKAQILLLDEPTNHLDTKNVAWLENYLTGLTDVTSIMVSHDRCGVWCGKAGKREGAER